MWTAMACDKEHAPSLARAPPPAVQIGSLEPEIPESASFLPSWRTRQNLLLSSPAFKMARRAGPGGSDP